jgi:1-acyl-sn-glycerol-3-phosphate acyltransferase
MMSCFWIDEKYINLDYSEYLGENYEKPIGNPSTIVGNHQSWIDIMVMMCR